MPHLILTSIYANNIPLIRIIYGLNFLLFLYEMSHGLYLEILILFVIL